MFPNIFAVKKWNQEKNMYKTHFYTPQPKTLIFNFKIRVFQKCCNLICWPFVNSWIKKCFHLTNQSLDYKNTIFFALAVLSWQNNFMKIKKHILKTQYCITIKRFNFCPYFPKIYYRYFIQVCSLFHHGVKPYISHHPYSPFRPPSLTFSNCLFYPPVCPIVNHIESHSS